VSVSEQWQVVERYPLGMLARLHVFVNESCRLVKGRCHAEIYILGRLDLGGLATS